MKINPDGTIDLEPGKDVINIGQQTNFKGANRWHRVRKFSSQLADAANSDGKGIFGKILGGLKRLGGFALSVANALGIQISWSSLWQFMQIASYTVYNFDWNQSDIDIKKQIESTNNLISNMAGYILGDASIRVVTVAVINGIPIKYPVVPAGLAVDIARERIATFRGNISSESKTNIENQFKFGIALIGQMGLQNLFYSSILSLRSLRMFGLSPVTKEGESWSFAKAVDKKIEQIKPEILREFVKGYLGGVENAFWDTGYIVSMGLDDIWRMDDLRNEIELGENKAVRINPEP
ncbi:hypothetical protein H6G54_26775 [Anabaena cylindrica FACHB-243]|uniref:Uncharacterized protein n=1 Tax=Anabaena cylindrica (strain ATCC 27899 / PCC 7122) TaxID=272123 RepID=K9ZH26_ANACC|nr:MULTISPECIES: hypothetical protein [Anabaena]AFZ57655.1 hypothetical protein Anacy_2191 [Anabaena cylindrica PCC 7122]MBD2421221.1 hypothetical protein [Anabaena cylindrica FACHB-243]MBY5285740.1 hypothetical protein [Anabaena sp. CCAP 1446/1C]MBY5310507.1 hypothetical protein [Anabaena sp. CCAP 1446/1C]MCM2410232.1 hypothetical protein [Anabaena sp. CCAP 1446/1C]